MRLHRFTHNHLIAFGRIALFIVYFWFGILKTFLISPANPLINRLMGATYLSHIMSFDTFIILFACFEMLIGILFLFKKTAKAALVLMMLHMITTTLPLIFLPEMTWQGFLTPTLEGQYIIKNIILIALALLVTQDTSKKS